MPTVDNHVRSLALIPIEVSADQAIPMRHSAMIPPKTDTEHVGDPGLAIATATSHHQPQGITALHGILMPADHVLQDLSTVTAETVASRLPEIIKIVRAGIMSTTAHVLQVI